MKKFMKDFKNESGQVLVLAVLMMTVLMGFAALAVDIGMVTVTKSKLQNAADAAALAGAASTEAEENTAINYAKINGLDDSVEGTEIDVEVDNVNASVSGSTTKKVYTAAEITQKISELETELKAKSDNNLIELANDMSVTTGLKTETGTYKVEDFEDTTDEELIELAIANSLTSYLEAKEHQGIITYSIKNKERYSLINALVVELNKSAPPISETTITDKNALITKLLEVQKKAWEDEEITVGQKKGNSKQVKVTLEKKVSYTFARILGFTEGTVSVHAVAEKTAWDGDNALPFINLDDKYGTPGVTLTGWNKVGPGDKERIHNDDLTIPPDKSTINVNYEDGSIMFKKGKDNSIGEALNNVLTVGNTVYLFSLSNDVIDSKVYEKKEDYELKNKDLIPLSDIVLLECKVTEFQNKLITLEFVKYYNWDASKNTFITPTGEKPDDSIRLIE